MTNELSLWSIVSGPGAMSDIAMQPVASSNLTHIGFDGNKTIRVTFKSGQSYDYSGGPDDNMGNLFEALAGADSKGRFFAQNIRGRFRAKWVE